MAQASVCGPLRIGDLRHEARLHPAGVAADVAGSVDERARFPLQPRHALPQALEQRGVKARADSPAVMQVLADVLAKQQ